MSEKYYNQHENNKQHEVHDIDAEKLDELLRERAGGARNEHIEKLDKIRQETKAEARPADEILASRLEKEEPAAPIGLISKDLRSIKYKRTISSVQKDLNKGERVLSKVIHNPIIDTASQAAEKTIARPSGLLSGGLFAFIGSSAFLWVSKHYGYEYNFLLFLLFFIGGFGIGIITELILRAFKR